MKQRGIAGPAAVAVLALLVAGNAFAGVAGVDGGIEFTYDDASAGSVSLAGDFNNWNMNGNPLALGDDGVWRVVIELAPGDYEYKFVVNGSEWIADPENPRIVGDYGNSGITINDDGEPVSASVAADAISNTPVNSRVKLEGSYRATYSTSSDVPSDPRLRLDRPAHEFYIGVNPTVTSTASGSAVIRLSTGFGDYKEISADIYSGHATLEGGPFTVTGYYNEELLQYDNPLETVGHIDVGGTIPEEHLSFGRGAQGIIVGTEFWDVDVNATYSNVYDYDIMNNPGVYDNTETDLLAARAKRDVGPVTVGATYTSWRDAWWIGFDNEFNTSPHIDEYIAESGSQSLWFELANTESWIGVDVAMPLMSELIYAQAEVSRYDYKSHWDVGNLEKVQGENLTNGDIDVRVGEMSGWVGRGVLKSSPMPALDLRLEVTKTAIDSMAHDDQYVSFAAPAWGIPVEPRTYTGVKGGNSPLMVGVFGPAPKRDEFGMEFDAAVGLGIFDLGLEFDRGSYEWSYHDTVMGGLFGDFDTRKGSMSRFAVRLGAAPTERSRVELSMEALSADYDTDYIGDYDPDDYPALKDPSNFETILTAEAGLWKDWSLLVDVRNISYTNFIRWYQSTEEAIDYRDESFVDRYIALVYSPRENIEVRVGYGVNPTNYIDTPVEGRGNGRERWLSEYLWENSEYDWLDAEKALEDASTIGVMAVITF